MIIRKKRINHPMETAAVSEEDARLWVLDAVRRERVRAGHNLEISRASLAAKLGVAPGTIENIWRGRLKKLGDLRGKITHHRIKSLEADLADLANELAIARARGTLATPAQIDDAYAALETTRALIEALKRV